MKRNLGKVRMKIYIQVLISIGLLFFFYYLGLQLYLVVFLGLFILLIFLLKGKLYRRLDEFLTKNFLFLSKLSPRIRKLIIVAVFILVYMLLKQGIFFGLKLVGIDIQNMIMENISNVH